MEEIWKSIKGFDGKYCVSSWGRIISYARYKEGRILRPMICNNGYLAIDLRKNGKYERYLIHRLVAEAFIPNPHHLPCVNHKDESRNNNRMDNLEWCTNKYNSNYGTIKNRMSEAHSISISQYTKDNVFIKLWPNAREIERQLGFDNTAVLRCCAGKQKTSYNYVWRQNR